MRILWITNMLLPEIAADIQGTVGVRRTGTWLDNWLQSIKAAENIELAVACISGKQYIEKKIDGVTYFVLPGNGRTLLLYHPSLGKQWTRVEESFHPDIVHIHGTEYTHGISYMRTYPSKKYILSIQGLLGPISREYYGGISGFETHRYRTIRELLRASGTVGIRRVYQNNIKYEEELIRGSQLAIGRYDFDKFYVQSINEGIKYVRCNYSLREEFYTAEKWNPDTAERNTIYAGAAVTMALKGGHVLLKAVEIVKRRYPDVKVIFVGVGDKDGNLICNGGYKRYIKRLVSKLGLEENVEYLPVQSAEGIIQTMNRSYCAVIPSAMDNGSTMLREALHLGVPAIASFRGGLTGLLKDGESGFFFDYPEYTFLAGRIMQLFEDCELAVKISNNAMNVANLLHDKKKNANELIALYQEVAQS